ncbi:N-formylglutamate amidohydrolase [Rhodobacteraceae bacterium 2376]|uniref:N-formylglutamate amidohydrolase n=1 Tax=Rhabdonatronobacter sediminivivens TaxID=2743469 RepID=A0A7Z0HY14_9RHOB|nr:N-formylglutamate amidohydrolase [Rhabdonatronobacter sediminivivens]NYS24401.1 N-formylglutamate amidohydrolase [Rhabdonatronobacter sediminivivens]
MTTAYHLREPNVVQGPVVFASPHSARDYPPELIRHSVLDLATLRSSEDAYVDLLVGAAPDHGAPLLLGGAPRAYVDYNRAAGELDPALIADISRGTLNPRVASGLGVIPRVVARGRAIYRGKISRAEAEHRLRTCWHPYHARLAELLEAQRLRFGQAILLDMHSMPHEAVITEARRGGQRPDIVIGDRFGASAAPEIVAAVEAAFADTGLRVARNVPFAGAYMVQAYGRPALDQHAVQIEIDRALYLDETRMAPHSGFNAFQRMMNGIVANLASIGRSQASTPPLAAE